MDTRYVTAVVAVARHGSFTRAACEMFMAQSTVSRQVGALERDLGVVLFHRGQRTAVLTGPGEAFLSAAEQLLEAVAAAEDAVRRAARQP